MGINISLLTFYGPWKCDSNAPFTMFLRVLIMIIYFTGNNAKSWQQCHKLNRHTPQHTDGFSLTKI